MFLMKYFKELKQTTGLKKLGVFEMFLVVFL
jgi:hypothetical protein